MPGVPPNRVGPRRDDEYRIILQRTKWPALLADLGAEPHWACPDCGLPCRCVGAARILKHERCGLYDL